MIEGNLIEENPRAPKRAEELRAKLARPLREPISGQRWVSARQHKVWRPPTDVYETDRHVVVKVEIAGMKEDDFDISLEGRRLIVRGIRHDPASKLAYQQMEIPYGEFETDVDLSWSIDKDEIEATYQGGFLSIRLPKAQSFQVPVVGVEVAS